MLLFSISLYSYSATPLHVHNVCVCTICQNRFVEPTACTNIPCHGIKRTVTKYPMAWGKLQYINAKSFRTLSLSASKNTRER